MTQAESELWTTTEVAKRLDRPAHRIIHLCETGVVHPTQGATGRGSVRRFNLDQVFRLLVALQVQEAGVQVPQIKPLMRALDLFHDEFALQKVDGQNRYFDLVTAIRRVSSKLPLLAYLKGSGFVTLVVPGLQATKLATLRIKLCPDESDLADCKVFLGVNLSLLASQI